MQNFSSGQGKLKAKIYIFEHTFVSIFSLLIANSRIYNNMCVSGRIQFIQ